MTPKPKRNEPPNPRETTGDVTRQFNHTTRRTNKMSDEPHHTPNPDQVGFEYFNPEPILSVVLPIELTNNNGGRGGAWYKSANFRKECESQMRAGGHEREPFPFPVRVEITRILGKRQRLWDSSSVLRGNYKEIEDSLVALGWFEDDSPKYITHTGGFQDENRKADGPATQIEIFPSNLEDFEL